MKKIGIAAGGEGMPHHNYHDALEGSGAVAVTLQPDNFLQLLPTLAGVLIPGGDDLNPTLYGEENTASTGVDDALDRYEFELVDAALARQLPILGICRGHELLNVYFGGSLWQNIRPEIHSRNGTQDRVHGSRVEKGSFLYSVYGSGHIVVNSAHHQAIRQLAPSLRAVQYSDDGLIEAVCHETLPIFSVQWHPERTCCTYARPDTVNGLGVFRYFLEKC